ncbi:metallophosphoesterase 1 isoform X1 [Bombyx mori]|uniref:Calcineurin-like phosphoesterase domain-containing protein n=2 Tax=Bombyx mori TaxID=7091 RepID=A0A8R1WJA0_BOMMO|nr:metallophosphoesterase 1 isoform X1 [Bombyx mori]
MRRVTKNVLLFLIGLLFIWLYCEYIIYFIVIAQCNWPVTNDTHKSIQSLKALMISDTHLLGPRRGHWLDKMRREWQMHQAFQTIMMMLSPDVVFVLGDLFDEGEWTNNKEFQEYVERFYRLFMVPPHVKMYVVAGNHDIGFHNYIRKGAIQRFYKLLNTSSVEFVTLKDIHFVLLNSMAMEGDSCQLCSEARNDIQHISGRLKCSEDPKYCFGNKFKSLNYSRPILLQHFPLYRKSDSMCTEPDSPPLPERDKPFRLKIDALSKEASEFLVSKIKPRAVFGGHTHHGCLLHHKYENLGQLEFKEYSIPSFSWRNRPDPKYMLVTLTPNDYNVQKCGLPQEATIVITAISMLLILACFIAKRKYIGR